MHHLQDNVTVCTLVQFQHHPGLCRCRFLIFSSGEFAVDFLNYAMTVGQHLYLVSGHWCVLATVQTVLQFRPKQFNCCFPSSLQISKVWVGQSDK